MKLFATLCLSTLVYGSKVLFSSLRSVAVPRRDLLSDQTSIHELIELFWIDCDFAEVLKHQEADGTHRPAFRRPAVCHMVCPVFYTLDNPLRSVGSRRGIISRQCPKLELFNFGQESLGLILREYRFSVDDQLSGIVPTLPTGDSCCESGGSIAIHFESDRDRVVKGTQIQEAVALCA